MKLADFGIRHAVRDEATGLTQFRPVTTEGWMCPADSQDQISPSFDIFSLACIFVFVASSGLHSLFGTDPMTRIANRPPMTAFFSKRLLKLEFLELIAQMLNFDSTKRPSSFDVLNHSVFNRPLIFSSAQYNGLQQEQQSALPTEERSIPFPSTPLSPGDLAADVAMLQQCLDDK